MLWNDVEFMGKVARVVPYAFIVVGFLFAMSGQYVQSLITDHVESLKEQVEVQRKHTAPALLSDVALVGGNKVKIIISAENDIPVLAKWLFVTKNNQVISGIMMESVRLHPTKASAKWNHTQELQLDRIKDGYVEFRLDYESVYSPELGGPPNLSGKIVRAYQLANDSLRAIPR